MAALNLPIDNGTGGFLVSEARGYRARESLTIALGAGRFPPGMILARLTADAGTGKAGEFVPWVSGAANGVGNVAAISYDHVNATAAAVQVTGIVRDAEVQRAKLVFAGTPDAAAKNSAYVALSALGIALR